MNARWVAVGAVAVFLLYALVVGWIPLGQTIGQCRTDGDADPDVRRGASAASTRFFTAALKRDIAGGYALLSPSLQKAMPQEKFQNIVTQIANSGGDAFHGLKLDHLYHVERHGNVGRAFCGTSADWVAVNAQPDVTQAHVLYSATTPTHQWALTAWMIKRGETWLVTSFYITISGIAGRSSGELMTLAQAQAAKGHSFNAYMLMASASATAYRGPDLQIAQKPAIDAALARMKVPAELAGKPPRTWKIGEHSYSVDQVTIVGTDKDLGLVIMYRDPTWDGSEVAGEALNRALIGDFVKLHGDYREAFGFLVARLLRPGENMGWGTVFDAKTGFAQSAATPAAN